MKQDLPKLFDKEWKAFTKQIPKHPKYDIDITPHDDSFTYVNKETEELVTFWAMNGFGNDDYYVDGKQKGTYKNTKDIMKILDANA